MPEKRLALDQIPILLPGSDTTDLVRVNALGTADLVLVGTNATLPGTPIAFTLSQTKTVLFSGYATFFASTFADMFFDLVVDGITYPGSTFHMGAPSSTYGPALVRRELILTAGPHTASLAARMTAGAGGQIYTAGGAAPPYISAVWATGTGGGGGGGSGGGASALVSQEMETIDPPGTQISTGSVTFVPVPGTAMVINLAEEKTVFFEGQATSPWNFFNDTSAQLGLRVDGIDYAGTEGGIAVGYYVIAGLCVNKALRLAPGAHTVELVWRWWGALGGARLSTGTDAPARLTAIYTEPVFGIGSLAKQESENTSGVPTTNSTAIYALIPGTAISLSLLTDQVVLFEGLATALPQSLGFNTRLGLRVDGIDYDGTSVGWNTIYPINEETVVVHKALALLAGPHTAQLILRQGSGAFFAVVANGVNEPSRLTAIYTDPQDLIDAGVGALTKQEAENITGVPSVNGTAVYALVSGTAVTFVLPTSQVVLCEGFGSVENDSTGFCCQLGVRVDGIDYDGSANDWDSIYYQSASSVAVQKAVVLAPGSHTIQLVFRESPARGRAARLNNSPTRPTRLTVIYTAPEAIGPSLFSSQVNATRISGNFAFGDTGGAWVDVPGPGVSPTFDLVFTPTITGKAKVTVQGAVFESQGYCSFGLRVNGIDLIPAGTDFPFGQPLKPHGYVATGTQGCGSFGATGDMGFSTLIDVTAGVPTTVRLRTIVTAVFPGGNYFFADAGNPLSMFVEYR